MSGVIHNLKHCRLNVYRQRLYTRTMTRTPKGTKRLLFAAGVLALAGRRFLQEPYHFERKTVLITGGSRGLGLAIARELTQYGTNLVLVARTHSQLSRAQADLEARGSKVLSIVADVTQQADIDRAIEQTVATFGGLDVVINVAGIIQTGPIDNITDEEFHQTMAVNAFAPLHLTRAALPYLRARRGRVLIVSSVGGKVAVPHLSSYSMSKFAVTGLGQALRAELAADGVGVTTVLPGLMQTGSPRNAVIKGQHEREYALFATVDNLPLISQSAQSAAQRILSALARNEAEVMIGLPATAMRYAQALAPQLVADLMSLSNRFLPGPSSSNDAKRGQDAESPLTRNNPLKRAAEQEFNRGTEED